MKVKCTVDLRYLKYLIGSHTYLHFVLRLFRCLWYSNIDRKVMWIDNKLRDTLVIIHWYILYCKWIISNKFHLELPLYFLLVTLNTCSPGQCMSLPFLGLVSLLTQSPSRVVQCLKTWVGIWLNAATMKTHPGV